MNSLAPALFLDRDGVVNKEIGYLHKSEQVEFIPGIFELCRAAQALGYKLVIVTNQAGIARGLYSEADFHSLMRSMTDRFAGEHVELSAYYYCPHHPEHGIGAYRRDCPSRKPQPGMILQAARDLRLDLHRSILIGDRCSDIQAGAAAAIGTLVRLGGVESEPCPALPHLAIQTLAGALPLLRPRPETAPMP